MAGGEQIVFSPFPLWRASLTWLSRTYAESKGDRAFLARMRGRSGAVRVAPECCLPNELYERLGTPAPPAGFVGTTFSDGALFSDGAGFAWPTPEFYLHSAAVAFDDEISIDLSGYSPGLVDGDWLGISGRAHIISRIIDTDGPLMTVGVEPPLRSDVSAGVEITTQPTIIMKLVSDDQGAFDRDSSRFVRPTVELIELPDQV